MNRRLIAFRLTLMVTVAGLLPIAAMGAIGIEILQRRSIQSSQEALQTVAQQAAGRIQGFLEHQRELVRGVAALASLPGADSKLVELPLDLPSIRAAEVVRTPAEGSRFNAAVVASALAGKEAQSDVFLSTDSTPVVDLCVPSRAAVPQAVCASIDLLELWRFIQKIHFGQTGYALALDKHGRLMASGLGAIRGAILTGEDVTESDAARKATDDPAEVPSRFRRVDGAGNRSEVLAGWAPLPDHSWTVVVEQPVEEALRGTRVAQWSLGVAVLITLLLSLAVGVTQAQRVLHELEIEERWRTAGRIAAGITHDLGHRLRVLQQTSGLAEVGDPGFLPQIRENLRNEVNTLKKFIADFSDLSRDVRALELLPLELSAFLESIRRTALPHAEAAGVVLEVVGPEKPIWTNADRHLLERAALNLVSNAIEASPRGGVVRLSAQGGARAQLVVSDQGPGISPERQKTLFDAFVSTKKTGAHIGMGLANVKRIAEAHGGAVRLHSQPSQGATFRIELPATPPPDGAAQEAA